MAIAMRTVDVRSIVACAGDRKADAVRSQLLSAASAAAAAAVLLLPAASFCCIAR
jgi:hypothetical protein